MKSFKRITLMALSVGIINTAVAEQSLEPPAAPTLPQVNPQTNITPSTNQENNLVSPTEVPKATSITPTIQPPKTISPQPNNDLLATKPTQTDKAQKEPYIDDNNIIIGTGSITGVYYPAGGAICRMMNRDRKESGIRCAVESTAGSIYNLAALRNAEMNFAIVQSDWEQQAFEGKSKFSKEGPFEKLRFLFSLHNEAYTVIVRRDSKIDKLDDIQGKIVNIGFPGTGVRATTENLLKIKGWSPQTFSSVTEFKPEEQVDALCDKKIDVMIIATGHPNGMVQDAMSKCETKIIPVMDSAIRDAISKSDVLAATTIPGGMYVGMPNDIPTFGFKAVVLSTTDTSDKIAYQLTKSVFDNLANFKQLHPVFYSLTTDSMINEGKSAPMHPGAMQYFQEKGLLKK